MKTYIFLTVLCVNITFAQGIKPNLDYIGEVKLLADINFDEPSELSHFRIISSFSAKYNFGCKNQIFLLASPSLNLLVGRGLGSSMNDYGRKLFRPSILFSLMTGYEWDKPNTKKIFQHRIYAMTAIQSIGHLSGRGNVLAMGTSFVMVDFKNKKRFTKNRSQQVGSLYLGIQNFEFSYINDGPPFHLIKFGDGGDRYWTGSGFMGWKLPYDPIKNNDIGFRLSFDRYTGYKENAYEISNFLKMDYIPYRDSLTTLFNRGSLRLGGFWNQNSLEVSINDNDNLDVQYWLHKIQGYSLHRTVNHSSTSIRYSRSFNYLNIEKP